MVLLGSAPESDGWPGMLSHWCRNPSPRPGLSRRESWHDFDKCHHGIEGRNLKRRAARNLGISGESLTLTV
eukprot:753319-Hanusia_phi.AAC.7